MTDPPVPDLEDPEELYQWVAPSPDLPGSFTCSICGQFKASRRGLVRNHVESIHFKGVFRYQCELCQKDFQGRNALAVHNSALHPVRPRGSAVMQVLDQTSIEMKEFEALV